VFFILRRYDDGNINIFYFKYIYSTTRCITNINISFRPIFVIALKRSLMPPRVCVRQTSTKTFDACGRVSSIKSTHSLFRPRNSIVVILLYSESHKGPTVLFYCLSETHAQFKLRLPLSRKGRQWRIESSHAKTHEVSCNNNSRPYECSVAIRSPHVCTS